MVLQAAWQSFSQSSGRPMRSNQLAIVMASRIEIGFLDPNLKYWGNGWTLARLSPAGWG
jgi:hypothetical protein